MTPLVEAVPPHPTVRIRPRSGWRIFELAELWHARGLLVMMARRDQKLRYRQTVLGVGWVVLQPLLAAAVLAFVFGTIARLPSDGVSPILLAYTGLVCWNLFAVTISSSSISVVAATHLVGKVYFPRLILPISAAGVALTDFAVSFVLMAVIVLVSGVRVTAALLTLPFWFAMVLALSLGLGFAAAALMVTMRDIRYIVTFGLQLLLYASPVAYAASAVPQRFATIYNLNPLVPLVSGFRWAILGTPAPAMGAVIYACCVTMFMLVAGVVIFRFREPVIADVI